MLNELLDKFENALDAAGKAISTDITSMRGELQELRNKTLEGYDDFIIAIRLLKKHRIDPSTNTCIECGHPLGQETDACALKTLIDHHPTIV